MHYIIGLGNPGNEYEKTRHNAGRIAVDYFEVQNKKIKTKNYKIIDSGEYMNHSGKAVAKFIKTKKAAENLIVVYDDIDLPLGTVKVSYNKGTGGHNGLESVVKAVKTKEFTRVRIGIAPATPKGKVKKPVGERAVLDFLLGNFSTAQFETLKKTNKKVSDVLDVLIAHGRDRAMNQFN